MANKTVHDNGSNENLLRITITEYQENSPMEVLGKIDMVKEFSDHVVKHGRLHNGGRATPYVENLKQLRNRTKHLLNELNAEIELLGW